VVAVKAIYKGEGGATRAQHTDTSAEQGACLLAVIPLSLRKLAFSKLKPPLSPSTGSCQIRDVARRGGSR